MQHDEKSGIGRREFLRAVGGASTLAVAAAAAVAPDAALAYDPGAEESGAKYQPDAADVQAFYRTNGYETLRK